MTGFYSYLQSVLPLNRILVSLAIGVVPMFIVLVAGLNSPFVTAETIACRTFSAFLLTSALCFSLMMTCEEYAIFVTKRELEHFIDDAKFNEELGTRN